MLVCLHVRAGQAGRYLEQGWQLLVQDNDTGALKNFQLAYQAATEEHNTADAALSLLNMGICTYGTSYSNGLHYATAALAEYKKLEGNDAATAKAGRLKCLQLISTIYSRQGKYKEAIELSRQVLSGFGSLADTNGYRGLANASLGTCYDKLGRADSATWYYQQALDEWLKTKNYIYLPSAYIYAGDIAAKTGDKQKAMDMYGRAMHIADSMHNKQAEVTAMLAIGKWHSVAGNIREAERLFLQAHTVATDLSDKAFYLNTLNALALFSKETGNYRQAVAYEEEIAALKDSLNNWEKDKIVKSLEVQFRVQQTQQELTQSKQDHKIARLTNYILWGAILLITLFSSGIIFLLRRIHLRDKQLLATKETLIQAINEEKHQKELLMQNEIEYKEKQLSALVLQMQQKNELMQELKDRIEQDTKTAEDATLNKIINKGVNHDKEWSDFNTYFESINKNFYSKLKSEYPDISPNDLKICALIKLNMSTKEMAGVLNISPDSVKTARYRLRKKLQLETEDNLTEFILSI